VLITRKNQIEAITAELYYSPPRCGTCALNPDLAKAGHDDWPAREARPILSAIDRTLMTGIAYGRTRPSDGRNPRVSLRKPSQVPKQRNMGQSAHMIVPKPTCSLYRWRSSAMRECRPARHPACPRGYGISPRCLAWGVV